MNTPDTPSFELLIQAVEVAIDRKLGRRELRLLKRHAGKLLLDARDSETAQVPAKFESADLNNAMKNSGAPR